MDFVCVFLFCFFSLSFFIVGAGLFGLCAIFSNNGTLNETLIENNKAITLNKEKSTNNNADTQCTLSLRNYNAAKENNNNNNNIVNIYRIRSTEKIICNTFKTFKSNEPFI